MIQKLILVGLRVRVSAGIEVGVEGLAVGRFIIRRVRVVIEKNVLRERNHSIQKHGEVGDCGHV